MDKRILLGGRAHGTTGNVLYGSIMLHWPTGVTYRRHGSKYWVPIDDSDDMAIARVEEYELHGRSMPLPEKGDTP